MIKDVPSQIIREISNLDSQSDLLEIKEAGPPCDVDWTGVSKIRIDLDKNNWSAKPKPNEINALLQTCSHPEEITDFSVGYDSRSTKLPDLERFKNIQGLFLGSKIKSYKEVHRLKKIKQLVLVNYKHPDLRGFSKLNLVFLRLIRGHVTSIDVHADEVLLQSCNKLESLVGASVRRLCLDPCHQVKLSTLKDVAGLEKLELRGCKCVHDLDFVSQCDDLKHLVITATTLKRLDFSPLGMSKSIRTLFMDTRLPRELEAAANSNRELIVSNGQTALWKGSQHPAEVYWSACEG